MKNSEPNHYETLGVVRTATPAEIKSAFRKLARELHPDLNPDPGARDRFFKVKEAYELLSNPARREAYDATLAYYDALARPRDAQPAAEPKPDPPKPKPKTKVESTAGADLLQLKVMLNRGRWNDAEALARRLIESYPREPVPYAAVADVLRQRGDYVQAAKYYAYAAQLDPRNTVYQRRHEEVLAEAAPVQVVTSPRAQSGQKAAVGLAGVIALMGACYVVLSRGERPLFPGITLINTWTTSLLVMLLIVGIAAGACLSIAGHLTRIDAAGGAALMRVPPGVSLAVMSIASFWLAALIYILVGVTQDAFNPSLTRALGAAVSVVLLLAMAAGIVNGAMGWQALAWGGNVAYLGVVCGWFVADSVKRLPS